MTKRHARDRTAAVGAGPVVGSLCFAILIASATAAHAVTKAPARSGSTAAKAAASRSTGNPGRAEPAARDTSMSLKAGQDATVFRSLTVQGEDRIRLDFERPELTLDLDPEQAPGLEWGNARDVLDRTAPDSDAPLIGLSARQPNPYLARPWLEHFASGAVARFRPAVTGVERWKLVIANSKGEADATFQGRGDPPTEIAWDGRSTRGALVVPGLTYSYVFEAFDKAGNKRNFVGTPFQVTAYRLEGADGPVMVFSGRELGARPRASDPAGAPPVSPIVLEAASHLNQWPRLTQTVRVTAIARSFEAATALAETAARGLGPHLIGDPARIQTVTEVEPDAPEDGTVRVAFGR